MRRGRKQWRTGWSAGLAAAFSLALAAAAFSQNTAPKRFDLSAFARPTSIPMPGDTPPTPEQVGLGAALFADTRLSRDGSTACATCHDPAHAFTDDASRGKGVAGVTLRRNTPSLWNLAWGESFFWDGRAATLEAQARGPIEHPLEMDMKLADAAERLKSDPQMVAAFTAAFGEEGVTEESILKALALFERTLVSPKTRFDRWVEGDETALTPTEIAGFELFTGRAGCSKCHGTWRFTDEAFHDIGLPESPDKGRGEIAGAGRNNAFKTPTLRELLWTAPYMHDGSLATIEGVNDHYFGGVENRPTIAKDVPLITPVSVGHRRQLSAFLRTLSSETPPQPMSLPWTSERRAPLIPVPTAHVRQLDRAFKPDAVRISKGAPLTIENSDTRTYAVEVSDPRYRFSADALEPGGRAVLTFPEAGTYTVTSDFHPGMSLLVEVVEGNVGK